MRQDSLRSRPILGRPHSSSPEEASPGIDMVRLHPDTQRFQPYSTIILSFGERDVTMQSPLEQVVSPPKSAAFYMSFLALNLMAFITSWDSTSLAVALPVRWY